MNRFFFSTRWLCVFALWLLILGTPLPTWAQNATGTATGTAMGTAANSVSTAGNAATVPVAQAPAKVARAGTPSFLAAVDTTLRLWSVQFQKLGLYGLVAVAFIASYLTGLVLFQILFASGAFAPRAASSAAWVGSLVLLFFGLMMLPQTWPWWAPYALLFGGLLMIAVLVSSLSKKAA